MILHLPSLRHFIQMGPHPATLWRRIDFFQMVTGSHVRFRVCNIRLPTKCNYGSQVGVHIWSLWNLKFRRYCHFKMLAFRLVIDYSNGFSTALAQSQR